jgi:hypothetical protein
MLSTNPERAVSCALFCKFIFTKPLKEIGSTSKTNALAQLEKFFYQGLEHKGVQLPAAINFTISKKLSQWVGFNAVGNKNNLAISVDVGFKFSKLPLTVLTSVPAMANMLTRASACNRVD